jgi:polar amino acid transport system substrate-binding protein
MAARPWRIAVISMSAALTVWVWVLATILFLIRWNAIERPGPPVRELFPYGEMRIGVDASNPPFAVATTDDLFGFEIDLGYALGEEMDIPVRFVNMGYDGLYDSIRADQVDLVISTLTMDPLRTNDVRYTQPYFDAGLVLVSAENRPISAMSALSGHSLAYEFGSDADSEARLWQRRIQPFETRPYELPQYALDAVRLGDADAALVDATSARLYLRDHRAWAVQFQYVTSIPYAIALRINRWNTWERVSLALQALADNGTLENILQRWL